MGASLSDTALFVLIAAQGRGKSDDLRVFSDEDLQHLRRELERKGTTIEKAVRELVQAGLVRRVGPKRLMCTGDGNAVKHPYRALRNALALMRRLSPAQKASLDLIPDLREQMAALCARERARRGARTSS